MTDASGECWICGKLADSREHIFKSRDLRRLFEQDGYEFENQPFHFGKDAPRRIPGPKSRLMKYAPSLCGDCNSNKTAACDRAYDLLSDWLDQSQEDGGRSVLPLQEIFGVDHQEEIRNLLRYFAKSLGCRIRDANAHMSALFPNPVSCKNLERFRISISRTQLWRMLPDYRPDMLDSYLGKGDLLVTYSRSVFETTGHREVTRAIWHENIGHFQINHWFNIEPHPAFGKPIDAGAATYAIIANDFDLFTNREVKENWLSAQTN
ncbi:hypothetical protein [Bradyrhizobium sp. USDA 3315]